MGSEDDQEDLLDKGITITPREKDDDADYDLDDICTGNGKFSNKLAIIAEYLHGTREQQCDGSLWGEYPVNFVSGFLGNLGIPDRSYYC